MQAASDIFLGWFRGTEGRDFYSRQLKDMKGSAKVEGMSSEELVLYGKLCGWALARAHARSGDRVQIAAYLGKSERFDVRDRRLRRGIRRPDRKGPRGPLCRREVG